MKPVYLFWGGKRRFALLAILFFAARTADITSTYPIIKKYGIDGEANPMNRWLFETCGFWTGSFMYLFFFTGILFLALPLYLAARNKPMRRSTRATALSLVITISLVSFALPLWNLWIGPLLWRHIPPVITITLFTLFILALYIDIYQMCLQKTSSYYPPRS